MAIVLILVVTIVGIRPALEVAADPSPPAAAVAEYPVYDAVVRSKFLTTNTALVIIERMTTIRLLPDSPIPPTRTFFEEQAFFDSRLPHDLILEFLFKNQQPARLGNLFRFGVPYRFISAEGEVESEARGLGLFPWIHSVRLAQESESIDRLAFSRVGFSQRLDQALVYVANDRPDGSGAGFLVWLRTEESDWAVIDTEVVWVARSGREVPKEP
jgi:hypothetical protein